MLLRLLPLDVDLLRALAHSIGSRSVPVVSQRPVAATQWRSTDSLPLPLWITASTRMPLVAAFAPVKPGSSTASLALVQAVEK